MLCIALSTISLFIKGLLQKENKFNEDFFYSPTYIFSTNSEKQYYSDIIYGTELRLRHGVRLIMRNGKKLVYSVESYEEKEMLKDFLQQHQKIEFM